VLDIATLAQAIAVIGACWAIISGIGAWKREFIGKRQIELAEQLLAKFFEVRDAVAFIRNPFSDAEEGKSRKRGDSETSEESNLLDRGYIVVERYAQRQKIFSEFSTLKYRCMATFGVRTEHIFTETNAILGTIISSAGVLATYYWQRQGRVSMEKSEFEDHLTEMHRHEAIFWDMSAGKPDEIKDRLRLVQESLEVVTAPSFQEPMTLYSMLTAPLRRRLAKS